MLIATWNVNGIRARLDRLLEWLELRKPAAVCLQELKADEDSFPWDEIQQAGYTAVAACQKAWNGVAVLARGTGTGTANLIEAGLPGMEDFGARVVTVEVHGDLKVMSVYVPNGKSAGHEDYHRKLEWLEELRQYLADSFAPDEKVVVAGDFNIAPADIDSYDPAGLEGSIFHTKPEREAYKRLIELGFSDLFRDLEPETPGFSWWDYRGGAFHKNLGLRIDLILASAPVRESCQRVWIDRDFRKGKKPSDHAPLIAELAS